MLVGAAAETLPVGTLINGFIGDAFINDVNAGREALDSVSPYHPVMLAAASGRPLFFNTAAMAMLGISETEPDPQGGYFVRNPDTGIITGQARGYAAYEIIRAIQFLFPNDLVATMYQQVLTYLAMLGVTSIQEMPLWMNQTKIRDALADIDLPIRLRLMCHPTTLDQSRNECMPPIFPGNNMLSAHGVKWHVDGSEYNALAAVTEPYLVPADSFGKLNFADDAFREIVADAISWPNAVNQRLYHVIGDRGVDSLLDAMDSLAPAWLWRFVRTRIEHGDMIRADQMTTLDEYNIITVMSPLFMNSAEVDRYRFGPERARRMYPVRSLREAGVHVAFGTDFIGEPLSPFLNLMFAVLHPVNPDEAVTMEEAVIMHTVESAYAEFQSFQKGKIKPGYLADLAVLSQDIFTISPTDLPDTYSRLTMVDGNIIYDEGML
jgi:predicted amidohydrolase YtcJ